MILGIGSDLVDSRRIERALARFDARFERRVFTEEERRTAQNRQGRARAATYAKRFAAKEACAKALGTGMAGLGWREIEVVNLPGGAPVLQLHGAALMRLEALTPAGMRPRLHLSLADEYPLAQAWVIISGEPV